MPDEPANANVVKEQLLKAYPPKVARKRAKHIIVNDPDTPPEIEANVRTVPGILTQRGCTYAGCKGVVIGPTRDLLSLTHGPIGCGYYSWLTRRNQARTPEGADNFLPYCASTDMQDEEIIFGGEKKLRQAIREAHENLKPKTIAVHATCPVGLIGDDIHQVAREMSEELGITVFAMSCEGYRGVSQSAGHHIANNALFQHVVGRDDTEPDGKYKVNLLGEYNIGGDAFLIEDLFERCGITLVATLSGNSSIETMRRCHNVELNLVMCHRSINYMADMMETRFGVPWLKINFIGAEATAKSLRKIAAYFEDPAMIDKVEQVIAEEMVAVKAAQQDVRSRCDGKLAMLFVGGSRAHHYQSMFGEIGMRVVTAGYEFAHRDDYEGRRVLGDIKIDADSRNIEELKVDRDEDRFRPRRTEEQVEALSRQGVALGEYEGMMPEMPTGSLVIDDVSHHETEVLIATYRPDVICAGIKEKYAIQKAGVPSKQLHNYDYGGPYAGFGGAINFYHEIDRLVNGTIWQHIKAPWEASKAPTLDAQYICA